MIKKSFIPSERYAAPEMRVVELNLSNMLMLVGSNNIVDADEENGDGEWAF